MSSYSVSEAAAAAGVTARAVRLYESKGLVEAAGRTGSGYRVFTDQDVEVLRFIRQGRSLGLSLEAIGEVLEISRNRAPCERTRALLAERVADIDATILDLRSLRASILKAQQIPPGEAAERCAVIEQVGTT